MTSTARPRPLRRIMSLTAVVLLAGVTSVACGSSDDQDDGAGGGNGDSYYPVTIATSVGEVTIEEEPENIVTLQDAAFESVVALGETPSAAIVGTYFDRSEWLVDWRDEEYIDRNVDVTAGNVDIEGIASKDPDLIIAPSWEAFTEDAVYGKLTDISPVLLFDTPFLNDGEPLGFSQVAKALNREDEASEKMDDFQSALDEAKENLDDIQGSTFSYGVVTEQGVTLSGGGTDLFEGVGMMPSARQEAVLDEESRMLSFAVENYSDIDGDIVFLQAFPGVGEGDPQFDSLDSMQGRVIIDEDLIPWAITNGGVLANTWAAAKLGEVLTVD